MGTKRLKILITADPEIPVPLAIEVAKKSGKS